MDNISPSRTVFEKFDFKFFRVWPRPSTPNGDLGSKNFILFESPYMTSCLTSMDDISSSQTVFEIFDFKVLGFDLERSFGVEKLYTYIQVLLTIPAPKTSPNRQRRILSHRPSEVTECGVGMEVGNELYFLEEWLLYDKQLDMFKFVLWEKSPNPVNFAKIVYN